MEMVALEELEDDDLKKLRRLIKITLCILTAIGRKNLRRLGNQQKHFIKVMPKDYKIALQRLAEEKN
jgi:glutamate synthase (ferredoxin)